MSLLGLYDGPAEKAAGDENAYGERVKVGDLVRMPDGRPGSVTQVEYLPRRGGKHVRFIGFGTSVAYAKVVSVRPSRPKKRFGIFQEHPIRFADAEIEKLEFIATSEEIESIDPEAP